MKVDSSSKAFTLEELLHAYHADPGQFGDPTVSMCAAVAGGLNEAQLAEHGDGRNMRRSGLYDQSREALLLAEFNGFLCQLGTQALPP